MSPAWQINACFYCAFCFHKYLCIGAVSAVLMSWFIQAQWLCCLTERNKSKVISRSSNETITEEFLKELQVYDLSLTVKWDAEEKYKYERMSDISQKEPVNNIYIFHFLYHCWIRHFKSRSPVPKSVL